MVQQMFEQFAAACRGANDTLCLSNIPQTEADSSALSTILGVIFGVLGAMAIIIIIIQAIKFATSNGDPQKAADARKGIIYALVGLAVSLSAEVVVRVVINRL